MPIAPGLMEKKSKKPLTPVSSKTFSFPDTPIGDRDRQPKIQVCLEFRQKEVPRSKSKRTRKVLEVTIMRVKYLPKVDDKQANPFVKLTLNPGGTMHTTDRSEDQYIEIFEFPVSTEELKGSELCIAVCDRKATRNAKCFGEVQLSLDHLQIGNPVCQWFNLLVSNQADETLLI